MASGQIQATKKRSVELGINAIDKLVKDNKPVSYRTVSELSREFDPGGEGIHPNTIRKNMNISFSTELPNHINRVKGTSSSFWTIWKFKQFKLNRDLECVRQRYMQSTKSELVEHTIRLKQYVAHQKSDWLKNEFEKFQ